MQICIYSPSENIWGGGQIYIDCLCQYLNENGLEAVIASSEPQSFSAPTMLIPSVARKLHRLISAPALASKLRSSGTNVVVLNDLSSLWLAPVFRFYGINVISLLHLYLQRKNEAGLGHGFLEFHFLKMASYFANRIYSVNKNNQEVFPVPVEFVGNFISPWFFETADSPEKRYDLGFIARLSPEKNVSLFVRLVAKLNSFSERRITALVVGRGDSETMLREEIKRFGMEDLIEVRQWVDRNDLPKIYDSLRCFAITSYHEGFATTVLESHARGVPVITTRSAGFCPEFVQSFGGMSGLVFEPKDVNSEFFLNEVLHVIDNSDAYGEVCRSKASEFTEERVLGKLYSDIAVLAKGKGS